MNMSIVPHSLVTRNAQLNQLPTARDVFCKTLERCQLCSVAVR